MGRAPCCDKANVKRGPWSPDEDEALKNYIAKHGTGGNWISLPNRAGLNRCGKSCRLRWLNYLRPDIKHGGFTEEEDHTICSLYLSLGSRWSFIASKLPGRTDNDVKNYWNTKLKKKLMARKDCLRTSNKIPELESYESYYTGKDSGHFLNCHRPEKLDPNPVSLPDDLIKFSECSGFATPSALPFDELTNFAPPSWQTFQNIELDSTHDTVSRFGFPDKHEVYDPYLANISLIS